MQNGDFVSIPKFHVLSNDALVFAVSLIFCTGKWIKLFTETVLAFNLHFQHKRLNLHQNKLHLAKDFGVETTLAF
jgi:hypothetical protein